MIFLSYLPAKDRERLIQLNDLIQVTMDVAESKKLKQERQEILGKSKSLKECTYEDLQDFKSQLFERFNKGVGAGVPGIESVLKDIQIIEKYEMVRAQQAHSAAMNKPVESNRPKQRPTVSDSSWFVKMDDEDYE